MWSEQRELSWVLLQTVYQLQFLVFTLLHCSKGALKKKSSRGSKKNSTRMPTKGKKEKAGKKPLAFVVKRTNEAALRTVHGDTTSLCTHTHCESASHPR